MDRTASKTAFAAGSIAVITALAVFRLYMSYGASVLAAVSSAVIAVCIAAGIYCLFAKRKERYLFFAAVLCLSVCVHYYHFGAVYDPMSDLSGCESIRFTAIADNINYCTDYSFSADITITEADGKPCSAGAAFYAPQFCDIAEGDCFSFTGRAEAVDPEDEYFSGKYLLSRGIYFRVEPADGSIGYGEEPKAVSPARAVRGFFDRMSDRMSHRLVFAAGSESGNLASALLLGKKNLLSASVKSDLRTLGMSHIAAVSGLHMSIIVGTVDMLLKKRVKPGKRAVISAALSVFVMLLTGCSPSVTRCAFMNIAVSLLSLCTVRISTASALALSAGAVALINPLALYDIGFIMSAGATFGIATLGAGWERKLNMFFGRDTLLQRTVVGLLSVLVITLSAQIFTFPVIWAVYGSVSAAAGIANLVFVPLAALILLTAPFVLAFGGVPLVSAIFSECLRKECGLFISLASALSARIFDIRLESGYVIAFCVGAAAVILSSAYIKRNGILRGAYTGLVAAAAGCGILCCCLIYASDGGDMAYYMTEGKNDCVLVVCGDTLTAIDVTDGSDYAAECIDRVLTERQCARRTLVLTHCHLRHISNICRYMEYGELDSIILPSALNETDENVVNAIKEAAKGSGCRVTEYDPSAFCSVKNGECMVKIAPREYIGRSTHPVICFSTGSGESNILYCGGAVFECGTAYYADEMMAESNAVIFGIHSPVIKEKIGNDCIGGSVESVIAANAEVSAALAPDSRICCVEENGAVKLCLPET